VAVRSSSELRPRACDARILDGNGKFVVPGFIDGHVHFLTGGFRLASVQLRDAKTPEEKISVEEALVAYTRTAARSAFAENDVGILKEGFLADFVVLDRDVTAIEPEEIRNTRVVTTVVGGNIVHD